LLISKGDLKAKAYRRALGLLELDRGKTYTAVCETIQVTIPTMSGWASDYTKKWIAGFRRPTAFWMSDNGFDL